MLSDDHPLCPQTMRCQETHRIFNAFLCIHGIHDQCSCINGHIGFVLDPILAFLHDLHKTVTIESPGCQHILNGCFRVCGYPASSVAEQNLPDIVTKLTGL